MMFITTVASTSRTFASMQYAAMPARLVRIPILPIRLSHQRHASSTSGPDSTPDVLPQPLHVRTNEQLTAWYAKLSPEQQVAHMRWRGQQQRRAGVKAETPVLIDEEKTRIPLTRAERLYGHLLSFRNRDVQDYMSRWAQYSRSGGGQDAVTQIFMTIFNSEPADVSRATKTNWKNFLPLVLRDKNALYGEGIRNVRELYESYNLAIALGNEAEVTRYAKDGGLREALGIIKRSKGRKMAFDRERLPMRDRFPIFGSLFAPVDPEIMGDPPNAQLLWLIVTQSPENPGRMIAQMCVRFDMVQTLEVRKGKESNVNRRRVIENVVFERSLPAEGPSSRSSEDQWFVKAKVRHNPAVPDFVRDMSWGDFFRRLWKGRDYQPKQIAAPAETKAS